MKRYEPCLSRTRKMRAVTIFGILFLTVTSCQKRQGELGGNRTTNHTAQIQEPPVATARTNPAPKNKMEGRTAAELFQEGLKLWDGKGVSKDPVEAVKFFQAAADRGDVDALAYLGAACRTGTGIAKDAATAAGYFLAAAEKGDARSQGVIASMLATGEGVPKNLPESVKWYRVASEQGLVRAQANLGAMYFLGQGVAKDDVEAYKWLHLAASKGDAGAVKNRGLVARKLTVQQMAEGRKRAAEFVPKKTDTGTTQQ